MGSLKLAEIGQIALATGDPLQCNEVAQRADRRFDAVGRGG